MNESQIRARIRGAIGEGEYPPWVTFSIQHRLRRVESRTRAPLFEAMAAIAAIALALVLVESLLSSFAAHSATRMAPASNSSCKGPVDVILLDDAGLCNAARFVTPLNVETAGAGHTVTLLAAYSDPDRTVLYLKVSPNDAAPIINQCLCSTDFSGFTGPVHLDGFDGHGVYALSVITPPLTFGQDRKARIVVAVKLVPFEASVPARISPEDLQAALGPLALQAIVPVQQATALSTPSPVAAGSWTVTFEAVDVTPSVIHVRVRCQPSSPIYQNPGIPAAVLDSSSGQLRLLDFRMGDPTESGARVLDLNWLRPAQGGTYRLLLTIAGNENVGEGPEPVIPIEIPAPSSGSRH